jgi:hypothetical protein
MSNSIWDRYPVTPGLDSVAMKDRLQKRILDDTHGATPAALVDYFREASRQFWRVVGRAYPETVATPMAVRESGKSVS